MYIPHILIYNLIDIFPFSTVLQLEQEIEEARQFLENLRNETPRPQTASSCSRKTRSRAGGESALKSPRKVQLPAPSKSKSREEKKQKAKELKSKMDLFMDDYELSTVSTIDLLDEIESNKWVLLKYC